MSGENANDAILRQEWKKPTSTSNSVHDFYLVEYVGGLKKDRRKCIRCGIIICAKNSGTTTLKRHTTTCRKRSAKELSNQSLVDFVRLPKRESKKGLDEVAKTVYRYHIPITRAVNCDVFQTWYKRMGFANVTYSSVNEELNAQYESLMSKVKQMIRNRDNKAMVMISFDKWTSSDYKKYLGVYIYINRLPIMLGLLPYVGFCGAEEVGILIKNLLEQFGPGVADVHLAVTDRGSDVQAACRVLNLHNFPCLAHVINLIVKRFVTGLTGDVTRMADEQVTAESDDEYSEDEIIPPTLQFCYVIEKARQITAKILRTSSLQDKILQLQKTLKLREVKVVVENVTRWNSLLCMLERFLSVKTELLAVFPNELDEYDWTRLSNIISMLKPFQVMTKFVGIFLP